MKKLEECARAAWYADVQDGMFEDSAGRDISKPSWEEMPDWHPRMLEITRAVIRCLMEVDQNTVLAGTDTAKPNRAFSLGAAYRAMLQSVLDESKE